MHVAGKQLQMQERIAYNKKTFSLVYILIRLVRFDRLQGSMLRQMNRLNYRR